MKAKKKQPISDAIKKIPYQRLFGNQFGLKYNSNYVEQLADEMYRWFTTKSVDSEGREQTRLWLRDFAISKGLNRQRISEYAKKNTYFSYVLELCKGIQESLLFKLGLTSKSAMPIFALKAVAGWRDYHEIKAEHIITTN